MPRRTVFQVKYQGFIGLYPFVKPDSGASNGHRRHISCISRSNIRDLKVSCSLAHTFFRLVEDRIIYAASYLMFFGKAT